MYYNILGVNKQATSEEIKRSYRKLAIKKHPDKGGNEEEFKKIVEAYEILSDSEKRAIYDRYGQSGLNGNNNMNNGGSNPFGSNFGGFEDLFRGFGNFQVPLVFQLDLSLEDFFAGKDYTIPINNARVKIVIQPGMYGGQELILRNRVLGSGPGRDLVFRLREIRHSIFFIYNTDHLIKIKINLTESLLGFEYKFQHLDGTTVSIRSKPGEITGADAVLMVPSLGMPVYDQPKQRGRLFVKCKLELPKKIWLEGEELDNLEMLLITTKDKRKIARNAFMTKYKEKDSYSNAETIAAVAETIAAVIDSNQINSNQINSNNTANINNTSSSSNNNNDNDNNNGNINSNSNNKTNNIKNIYRNIKKDNVKIKTEKEKDNVKIKSNALLLIPSDITEFGKFGIRLEDEEDPDASPFTHYFFR